MMGINKAFIAPKNFLDLSNMGDFLLVLAQDLDDPLYVKAVQSSTVYLDNGAHEGEFKGIDWYLEQIEKINPDVVFAPDVINDPAESFRLTNEFIDRVLEKYYGVGIPFKIAAVPHGNDPAEYAKYYDQFLKNTAVSMIGISYLDPARFYPKIPSSDARRKLLQRLTMFTFKKPAHLLGASDGFSDIMYARGLEWVHSWDSSTAFMHGYDGGRFVGKDIDKGKPRTLDPKITELTKEQRQNILYNITFLKNDFKPPEAS
jgi:hypothetical protein